MYAPLGVKSRDKGGRLHDYTEAGEHGGEFSLTIGRSSTNSSFLLAVQRRWRSSGLENTTGSSARKRGRRFFEGLSPQWGPMTDLLRRRGRCRHPVYMDIHRLRCVRPHIYVVGSYNNLFAQCLATEVSFIVISVVPKGDPEKGTPREV